MTLHIPRALQSTLSDRLANSNKIIVLYGPRQVGKTTLIRSLLSNFQGRYLEINADEGRYSDVLSSRDFQQLQRLVSGYDLLFIDEAQRISDIGINLKILHDQLPALKIIATGSSSFELANKIHEPLTGRTWTYNLYPVAVMEWGALLNGFELDQKLREFLQFGMYPGVFDLPNQADKIEYLYNLSRSYLYKDVLDLGGIRHADKVRDLLRLLAYQTGSLVSFSELGRSLNMSTETVQSYVDLLQKAFVLVDLSGFSRNLRKEIVKNKKIYFTDLGIRNAIIENFQPPETRHDVGPMWENFLVMERLKRLQYNRQFSNRYFWRTYTGAELDYIEEQDGRLQGYEFKWGPKIPKAPPSWLETYPEATFAYINRENYLPFLSSEPV